MLHKKGYRFHPGRKYDLFDFVCYSKGTPKGVGVCINPFSNGLKYLTTENSEYAQSAAIWDKELKTYYKRKIKEGKAHQSVINAIACKLLYRVFAVIKRDEPYVKLVR